VVSGKLPWRSKLYRWTGDGYSFTRTSTLPRSTTSLFRPVCRFTFRLTSTSVMNSFFIPQVGSQIYTMPGITTQLNLQVDKPGRYEGISAQFSGPGFSDMRFAVTAGSTQEFETWLAGVRQRGVALDSTTFAQLARPTKAGGELTYGAVPEDPFDAVVHGRLSTRWSADEAL
jgi:hypothetical protein